MICATHAECPAACFVFSRALNIVAGIRNFAERRLLKRLAFYLPSSSSVTVFLRIIISVKWFLHVSHESRGFSNRCGCEMEESDVKEQTIPGSIRK